MLNPSTANLLADDPTVRRCGLRAREYGYGGLIVTNLFALRSTNPARLKQISDPVGPHNDAAILFASTLADQVVCAWGLHGKLENRSAAVRHLLWPVRHKLRVLRLTDAEPWHPLYLPFSDKPKAYEYALA